jgi:hypothetical protein
MRDWARAWCQQLAVWLSRILELSFWLPLVIGFIVGSIAGAHLSPSGSILTGLSGLWIGGILGAIATFVLERSRGVADQVRSRKPLNSVLGPIATDQTTIYIGPFARPIQSELRRLDRAQPFDLMPSIRGTELVVGLGDTIALSFIYAALLRAGKSHSEISVEHHADLETGRWGINFISIGAANARTREVLGAFEETFFGFADNYSAIVRRPRDKVVRTPAVTEDGERIEMHYERKVVPHDGKDYGVVLKLKDQARDEGNRIIIVAGIGGDGTAGAAFYLWRSYRELAPLGDTFGVLIETPAGYESARMVDFEDVALLRTVQ